MGFSKETAFETARHSHTAPQVTAIRSEQERAPGRTRNDLTSTARGQGEAKVRQASQVAESSQQLWTPPLQRRGACEGFASWLSCV